MVLRGKAPVLEGLSSAAGWAPGRTADGFWDFGAGKLKVNGQHASYHSFGLLLKFELSSSNELLVQRPSQSRADCFPAHS